MFNTLAGLTVAAKIIMNAENIYRQKVKPENVRKG